MKSVYSAVRTGSLNKAVCASFCIYLRTNSDLCHLQHKLIGFYNRDEKCLQRGTDWVFKRSSLRFIFKGSRLGSYLKQKRINFHYKEELLKSVGIQYPFSVKIMPNTQMHYTYRISPDGTYSYLLV